MELNTNFAARIVVHAAELDWIDSPIEGVQRRMLDRIGDEVARATSIVKYAPRSAFSPHVHTGGEEFIVLDGVFSDEHGDFPAGSYIRNPPTSSHTPGSTPGCVIFVKLWQFDPTDRTHVRLQYNKMGTLPDPERTAVRVTPLYEDERETVQIEHWAPGAKLRMKTPEGAEFLVLDGNFTDAADTLNKHSWLRLPMGGELQATAGSKGAKVWVKTRHLRFVAPPSP